MEKRILILALGLIFLLGCTQQKIDCPVNTFGDRALVDIKFFNAATDINNNDVFFYEFYLANYGKQDAHNVVVECHSEVDGNNILSVSKTIGNLEGQKYMFLTLDKEIDVDTSQLVGSPVCKVISCSDCDKLTERIKDQQEAPSSN